MKKLFLFLAASCVLLLSQPGCKTDFDVIAPYREIPVVYGLLNVSDTVQWVRIQKAFLGEGNALVMAQQPDSTSYADILDVKIEEYAGNKYLRTLSLVRDSSVAKEQGLFPSSPNFLYRTQPGENVVAGNRYVLRVHNLKTDSLVTAGTEVVDSISIVKPVDQPQIEIKWYTGNPLQVQWTSNDEGYLYQLAIRFHFTEENLITGASTPMTLNWIFPEVRRNQAQQGSFLIEVNGEDFYKFVGASLEQNNNVKRHIGTLDFSFTVAGEDFATYVDVNHPPTGINQNIPAFTNVEGGIGVFSSRLTQSLDGKNMDKRSRDSLIFGSYTELLGFQ